MENVCPKCLTCRYLGKEREKNDPFTILVKLKQIDNSNDIDSQDEEEDIFVPKKNDNLVFKCEKFDILNEMSKDFNGIHSSGIILKYPYNCSNYEFFELDSIEEI